MPDILLAGLNDDFTCQQDSSAQKVMLSPPSSGGCCDASAACSGRMLDVCMILNK
jgi:hypothetical protein